MPKPPDARLAAALRENLKRRKAAARAQPKSQSEHLVDGKGCAHLDEAGEASRPAADPSIGS